MTWTVAEVVTRLRELDETSRIETKRGLGDAAMDTVSAFSNEPDLCGGWIVFGVVRDEEGRHVVEGVAHPDQLQADFANQCRNQLNRAIRPELQVDLVDGERVVVAFVPEAAPTDKPVYRVAAGIPKGAYRRIGSTDQRLNDDDLRLLASRAQQVPYDRRPVAGAERDDLDPEAIATYRRQLREARPTSELLDATDEYVLRAIGALVDERGRWVPTVAGVLLFGRRLALRRLFPAMRVDYIRVRGTRWTGDDGDRYDSVEIREALITGWRRAFAAILDDLPVGFELPPDQPQRRNVSRLPERVVREALFNALCHRDYEVHGAVQLRRFADRLEIENPGGSLVPEEQWGQPVSRPRNPSLIDVFRDLDLAEARGTGIRRMRERMAEAGLSAPILESQREPGRFVVTLMFHHFLDDSDVEWLGHVGDLDDVDAQVLIYVRKTGQISNREVRAFSQDDTLAASKRLGRLRDRGLLEQHGSSHNTVYLLGPAADRTAAVVVEPREVPAELQLRIAALPEKASFEEVAGVILDLCRLRYWEIGELGRVLSRNPRYLRTRYILPLVDSGRLVTLHLARRHPRQAYGAADAPR